MTQATIDTLYDIIAKRADEDANLSYTARMMQNGRGKIAQKLGEEAVECVIEVMKNDKDLLIEESADLLYHLTLAWYASAVKPDEVWACLQERMDKGGKS
ncbi:MAG: phosphoribosyl-ATP diphosphatase [Pseudomonadota bacterium]